MKIKYGLSGFLAPDGQYYECAYQEHQRLATQLVTKYNIQFNGSSNEIPAFIKFGCHPWVGKEGDGGCHCFIWDEPTKNQLDFMRNNFEKMTKQQQLSVLRDLDSFNINIENWLNNSPDNEMDDQENHHLIEYIKKAEIKQPGSNPWQKILKRSIYRKGTKFFIRHTGSYSVLIDGRQYREVRKVLDTWFLQ